MQLYIQIAIISHALLGGVGLFSGITNIYSKKGSKLHRKAGKVFLISIISSTLLALFITMLPDHKNLFLLLSSIITIYLVLTGNRARSFKMNRSKKLLLAIKLFRP